jgi:hypothetical protein
MLAAARETRRASPGVSRFAGVVRCTSRKEPVRVGTGLGAPPSWVVGHVTAGRGQMTAD